MMSETFKHPIQPLSKDEYGTWRFKENEIVTFLLKNGGYDLNDLAIREFPREDREQFAQLIGYSLSGFSELSYVDDDTYDVAVAMTRKISQKDAKIQVLTQELADIRKKLKPLASLLFEIHPDDSDE